MKKENLVEKLLGVVYFAVGIVLLFIGIGCALYSFNVQKSSIEVIGEIVSKGRIEELDLSFERESLYGSTWVIYELNGKNYLAGLNEESSSWYDGKEVTLYVDREDPLHVRTKDLLYLAAWILFSIGLVFLVLGFVFLMIVSRRRKRKRQLMEKGERIWAEITGGRINNFYTMGMRHPYKLECKYTDPYSGQICIYESGNVFLNLEQCIGRQVAVFVDRENPGRYYVDVESL